MAAEVLLMVYHTTTPFEPHAVHSERLMRHAWRELAQGDRAQASEKAWGAFAHGLKVVANERFWEYMDHNQVRPIVLALFRESGDPELQTAASVAHELHINYYCDEFEPEQIEHGLQIVEDCLERLKGLSRRYREDAEYREQADALLPPYRTYNARLRQWEPLPTRRRRPRRRRIISRRINGV